MSKEVQIKKDKKVSSFIDNYESNISENNEYNLNTDEDFEIDNEEKSREYYLNTINIIRKNILNYVEDKSLPLCEFLYLKDIKMLLRKSNNF
jgi:hypothetical protein